jgi:hypothetical protein
MRLNLSRLILFHEENPSHFSIVLRSSLLLDAQS